MSKITLYHAASHLPYRENLFASENILMCANGTFIVEYRKVINPLTLNLCRIYHCQKVLLETSKVYVEQWLQAIHKLIKK